MRDTNSKHFTVASVERTTGETAEVIDLVWDDPQNLIVVSSDLSHHQTYETATRTDAMTSQAIADLNKQIDIKMLVLESEDQYGEGIPVQTGPKTPDADDLVEQIDAYFGTEKQEEEPKTVASSNDA